MKINAGILALVLCAASHVSHAACSYTLTPAGASYSSDGGSNSFGVSAGSTCSWTATTTDSWLHTTNTGRGAGSVNYSVDANSSASSRSGTIVVGTASFSVTQAGVPLSLGVALDNTNLVWETATDYPWHGTNNVTYDGVDAAVSGNHFQPSSTSWIQTTVVGPGTLAFWWKVDSDFTFPPLDDLEFLINGDEQDSIRGQIDWNYRTFDIPEGTNILTWQYVKDDQFNSGNDSGWLDQVTYITAPPIGLADALNACAQWSTGGNTNPTYWTGETNITHDGIAAARSGAIYTSQETWMQATVSGVTNLSFWWKVSCQTNYDYLDFYTNNILAKRITGEVNWQSNSFKLTATTNTLKWRYWMTNIIAPGVPMGQSAGWVDQVAFSPGDTTPPTVLYSFTNLTLSAGSNCQAVLPDLTGTNYFLAADSCSSVTVTQTPLAGTLLPLGTNQLVLTARDGSGNIVRSTNTVAVEDLTPPVIVYSFTNLTLSSGSNCQALLPNLTGTNYFRATDNCSSVTVTQIPAAGTLLPLGPNPVILVAQDASGNIVRSTNSVVVADLTPPVIAYCFTNLTLSAGSNCQAALPDLTGTNYFVAADNCSSLTVTQTPAAGTLLPRGTNQIILTAQDASGNAVRSTNTVVVADLSPPVIVYAFTNMTLSAGSNCQAALPDLTGTNYFVAADNCSSVTVTQTPAAGTLLLLGTNQIVLTAQDASGNTVHSTNTVVVADLTPPVIVYCFTNMTLSAGSNCQAALPDLTATNYFVAADNCSSVTVAQTPAAGTLLPLGTNQVVLTAQDASSNFVRSTNSVIVADLTPPVIVYGFTNLTLSAGSNCQAALPDLTGTNYFVATDNCSSITVTQTPLAGTLLPLGTNQVVLSARDASGNRVSITKTVLVADLTPPVILYCFTNLTVNAATNCQAVLPDLTGTNYFVAADNCGSLTISQAPLPGSLLSLGTNELVLTAMDAAGNAAASTNVLIVVDTTPPVLLSPADVEAGTSPGQCQATNVILGTPTVSDNCALATVTNDAPSVFPVGTNLVTWTAVDAHGNSAVAVQKVIVTDIELPMILCPPPISVRADAGHTYASSVVLGTPTASDNCGVASVTNDAPSQFPLGTNTVIWTVTDIHGNQNTCAQQVVVTEAPHLPHWITGIVWNSDGSFTLSFTGEASVQYVVQASTNLLDWLPLKTNIAPADGIWNYTDSSATNFPSRYYRSASQ